MRYAASALLLCTAACASSARVAAPVPAPGSRDPRLAAIVAAPSAGRLDADLRTLVGVGTRHTLSDTLSATRGIGAARRWLFAEFERISAACGGCLEVRYVSEVYPPRDRIPEPTNVVSVAAILRGTTDPGRVLVMTGHFDSRVSGTNNATDSAPGANDDGSGTIAVLEAARVLTRHRFNATIVFATLAGEEQGLLGGQTLARLARDSGWRVEGNLNNDIVGNTRGGDGVTDDRMIRVFSDGTPPTETDAERRARRSTGGEVDGISRQLARYVQMIARRHVPAVDIWPVYRLDRFGRGGDHRAFADLGFAAVRFSEGHEDYTRQHQDIRVENGIRYGDVLEGVNTAYVAKVVAVNAASLASLAWAPGTPRNVAIGGAGQYAAVLRWQPPDDSATVAGYRVYWRRTDSPTWDHFEDVGPALSYTATGRVVDNWFFGVAALSREGHESLVVFPTPPPPRPAAPARDE